MNTISGLGSDPLVLDLRQVRKREVEALALFEALKAWRDVIANKYGADAYVFSFAQHRSVVVNFARAALE